jgi:hypothetical protein
MNSGDHDVMPQLTKRERLVTLEYTHIGMCVSRRSPGGRECPDLDCAVAALNFATGSAGTRPRS